MLDKLFPNSSKEFEKFLNVFVDELSKNVETVANEVTKEIKNTKEKIEEEVKNIFKDENEKKDECKKVFQANVYENDENQLIEIAMPGVNKDNIHIDLEEPKDKSYNSLIIIAERTYQYENYKKILKNIPDEYTIELTFSKEKYDIFNSVAEYDNGILKIIVPFKKKVKKIKIN